MLGTPDERFQEKFVPLLTQARELADALGVAVDEYFGEDGIPGDKFPEATVQRQLIALSPLYHAAVAVLIESETTLGSLALMRCLIEAWTHLYFIMGEDRCADAACRAIRLELGWAAAAIGFARTDGSELSEVESRLREIELIKTRCGCKGGRRDYGDVDQTVTTMARLYEIDWLPQAWRSTSQTMHVAGWEWRLRDRGDGTSAIVHASPSHRAVRLNQLVVLFYNVSQTALVVIGVGLDSDPARDLHERAMRILDDRFLRRAIDGDYD